MSALSSGKMGEYAEARGAWAENVQGWIQQTYESLPGAVRADLFGQCNSLDDQADALRIGLAFGIHYEMDGKSADQWIEKFISMDHI